MGSQIHRLDAELAFATLGPSPGHPRAYLRFSDMNIVVSDPLRGTLKWAVPKTLTSTRREVKQRQVEYLNVCPPEVSPFFDSLAHFLVAFVAGIALLMFMLVMSLLNVLLMKSLIAVPSALVLFVGGLSIGPRAINTETMIVTATCAAVLVVFVGTTT